MAGTIAENMASVFYRIERAAKKSGRVPSEITLVVASKTVEPKRIKEAIKAGGRVFGENYIQEAREKSDKVKKKSISWHFIGHLQKNKVKHALELFDIIETIDTFALAKEVSKKAKEPVDVLIEVNIAGEKTKSGVSSKDVTGLVRKVAKLKNINIKGLMAIPPYHENKEHSRPYFITLRRLAERINKERIPGVGMHALSIGMSDDFEVAIEEGATIIRVGRAIFGERPKKEETTEEPKAETKKPAKTKSTAKKPVAAKPASKTKTVAKKAATPKAKAKVAAKPKAKKAATSAKAAKGETAATTKKPATKKAAKGKKTAVTAKKPAAKKTTAPKKATVKTAAKKAVAKKPASGTKTSAKKTTTKKAAPKKS